MYNVCMSVHPVTYLRNPVIVAPAGKESDLHDKWFYFDG